MKRISLFLFLTATLCCASTAPAQKTTSRPAEANGQKAQETRHRRPDMGDVLINGLRGIEGCLAAKTCEWSDGKQSIVAWFENKAAAVRWYNSDTHQAMMVGKTDGSLEGSEPMMFVEDEDLPIMVIATLTPAAKPELPGVQIPISQISIELFAALPGGAQVEGRVSPPSFKVPHMRDYSTAQPQAAGAGGD